MSSDKKDFYEKTWWQRLISIIVILLIIYSGFYFSKKMIMSKKRIKRVKPKSSVVLVKTIKGEKKDIYYKIFSFGKVVPARQVTLMSEVSGKIIYFNNDLVEGKFLKKGEVIAKVDDTDYLLDVRIKEAKLKELKEELKIEIGKQKSAEKEYSSAKKVIGKVDNESLYLLLRKPFINKIKANIEIARNEIELAKRKVTKSVIKAPFDAYVLKKYIDEGSFVNVGSKIADLIYANEFYVISLFPVSQIKWLDLDDINRVKVSCSEKNFFGKIKSLEKSLDEKGLMAKAVVSVNGSDFLMVNDYCNTEIYGKKLAGVLKLPLSVLRDENHVWIYDDGKLVIKKIDVIFKDKKSFYTRDLSENTKLIVSNIATPVNGMKLQEIEK